MISAKNIVLNIVLRNKLTVRPPFSRYPRLPIQNKTSANASTSFILFLTHLSGFTNHLNYQTI